MLTLARDMNISAGEMFVTGSASTSARTDLYEHDVQLNRIERTIRKQVVAHLSMPGNRLDVPYALLLTSLVKDVERIGDYAKHLSEIVDIRPAAIAEDEIALGAPGNQTGCGGLVRGPLRGVRKCRP